MLRMYPAELWSRMADLPAIDLGTEEALALVNRLVNYYPVHAERREQLGRMVERIGLGRL